VESYVAERKIKPKIYRPKTNLINENENFKHKTWILPNDTIKGFSVLSLSGSIAQNKIAGVITDGDGKKLTTVVYNKTTNIKVFTDAGAFEFDLKKSGSFDFVFFKEGYPL
jgi:Fe(3+) dicitrate transport protein